MEDVWHCVLLSQACQAKLSFTRAVRHGTITMEDYDGQHLEVVRQAGTGLFMIRIDHLVRRDYIAAGCCFPGMVKTEPIFLQGSETD